MVAAGARPGQSPPTEGNPRTEAARIKGPGPRPAPGRRIVPGCRALNEGTTARRQWRSRAGNAFPSAAPSAARDRRELSRRCLSPRASFDATRRTRVERGHRRSRRCGRGRFPLSCRHKKDGRPPGETRPITANRRHPRTEQQGSKHWTPACAGATNRARMPCPNEGTTARRQWRSRAGNAFPSAAPVQPAAGGNCRVDV